MDRKKFAVIQYDHGEQEGMSRTRRIWFAAALLLAFVLLFVALPLGIILGIAALLSLRASRHLFLGPRYLICGQRILYYANIERVAVDAIGGRIILQSSAGQDLILEQEKFQTKARKPGKIAANKAARFKKVAQKIATHVRRASPNAQLAGVEDLPAMGP